MTVPLQPYGVILKPHISNAQTRTAPACSYVRTCGRVRNSQKIASDPLQGKGTFFFFFFFFFYFREKISFFIRLHNWVFKSSVCYLVIKKYFQNKNCEVFLSAWVSTWFISKMWPKRNIMIKMSQIWPNKILHQKKSRP